MDRFELARKYLAMINDIVASAGYLGLDDATVSDMKGVTRYLDLVEPGTTDGAILASVDRINNLVSGIGDADVGGIYAAFMADINRRFGTCIDERVLYYGTNPGTLPERRPYRYNFFYRVAPESPTEYVDVVAYTEGDALTIFLNYIRTWGPLEAHSTDGCSYVHPLYFHEDLGAIIGANYK